MRNVRDVQRDALRLWRLCRVDGRLDERRIRIVCERLIDAGEQVSPALLSSFRRLLRDESARHMARVESAVPLDAPSREAIDGLLAARYGDDLTTTFAVNPELLGGLRIIVGSDVYDDSVRARLVALNGSFER